MISRIRETLKELADDLYRERETVAVLVREPLIDSVTPNSTDVDVILVDLSKDMGIENIRRMKNGIRFDIMTFSMNLLLHDEFMRYVGNFPHQLVACSVVKETANYGTMLINRMKDHMEDPTTLQIRVMGHIKYANQLLILAERAKYPSEAFFYLNTATSGFVSAMCDGQTSLINVQSKPYLKLARVKSDLIEWFVDVLMLKRFDINAVEELGKLVCDKYKDLKYDTSNMNREFRSSIPYFIHPDEVQYRLRVIKELASKGDFADATHYGRVYAYCLMCGMVHLDRLDKVDTSSSYLRHYLPLSEAEYFDVFAKLFPVTREEFDDSLERMKMFRRMKICPTQT